MKGKKKSLVVECHICNGTGISPDNMACENCNGLGIGTTGDRPIRLIMGDEDIE